MPPKAKPKGGRSAKLYKFPERLPEGEVLQDTRKTRWILGPSIGKGGFGEIYSAASYVDGKPKDYPYVIKIEPHENGPLFVEMHFYQKVGKAEEVEEWKKKEKVDILGIPSFYGSGSHTFDNYKYRFIVIDRFGKDLWSIFLDNNKSFPVSTVCKCAVQILDVLKYIHGKGYTHGDIKGANLLLGYKQNAQNNVFLVDFGLACKHSLSEFKPNPKRAGDGTIEYTSCDMHVGVPTQRGDLEILGYNLLHWLAGRLPWEGDIKSQETVHRKKKEFMENASSYLKKNFPTVPTVMSKYFDYVSKLKPEQSPDMKFCKSLFMNELKSTSAVDGSLFPRSKTPSKTSRASKSTSDSKPDNKKKVVKPRGRTSNAQKNGSPSTNSDDDMFDDGKSTNKRSTGRQQVVKPRGRTATAQKNGIPSSNSDDDDGNSTNKRSNDSDTEEEEERVPVKRVRRVKKVVDGVDKPSWKDSPTVAWTLRKKTGDEDSTKKTGTVRTRKR